ncbi:hypothetical protein PR202_gb23519 [Eleusine coracana subsp. coracana]|uniref:Trafficking protein particle complex II-specific subunit 130 homolog n=1 Tax=Eleusine coracana subsp. coracana TaxID=191504 RepID=A0AAV5FJ54_ELECO|nr:hypothetical protein PR202_gb23519 [Eleusine coracana subsp. coracana]
MANYLAQFPDHQVLLRPHRRRCMFSYNWFPFATVEDVSDLWLNVKESFERRLPVKKACLNNKARNPVFVENLPAEFIQTTDSRLRSRFPQEQYLFWFREPYATVVLVTCEDLDEFKTILKPRLKLIVQNDEREWFIVFVSKAHPSNDQATKMAKKVYARLEADFNTKKRERCCKFDLHGPDAEFWDDFDSKMVDCIRNTLDRRVQFYEEEIRRLSEQRFTPIWNFCNFFILKHSSHFYLQESLAFMFEMSNLHEDSLREYDELELCYSESVNSPGKHREFGGLDAGDDQAALLNPGFKALTQIVQDDVFREFEFRQYIFACQAKLLFKLSRPTEVAARGYAFVVAFSKTLALHEFMRLAYLIGYGAEIEKSPINSASLSMLPWPKPATWPSIPPDSSSEIMAKEKMILQAKSREKLFNIHRKPLPLEPSLLLREANRRRAFLSVGNISELYDTADGSGLDGNSKLSPNRSTSSFIARTMSEGWEELLADVLPDLAECQKILSDEAGYLASCVKLLSLDSSLFSLKERQAFQSEVVRLAHSEMKHLVPLDVSSLITFAGNAGPPLELCDGDPGTLSVAVWSGFPDDIMLESLSLRLSASSTADEGRNIISFDIPPQKPGSYVLGALTGQIGKLSFRSHGFSQDGPVETDEFMSFEKPTRPVLKVRKPRALVDITPAVSSALLMNELQWIGLIVKPIDYSLKGGILHIDAGAELKIEESQMIEIENYRSDMEHSCSADSPIEAERVEKIPIENGKIKLPDWASDVTTLVWFPVRAIDNTIARGETPASPQKQSIVDGMRMIALKLEFGVFHNQVFESSAYCTSLHEHLVNAYVHMHVFLVPMGSRYWTGTMGTMIDDLHVILCSEVKASLHTKDMWLDLQSGFEHLGKGDGRPASNLFPLVVAPSSKAGILFIIRLSGTTDSDELENTDSILNVKYGISGDRTTGAHSPVPVNTGDSEELMFKIALKLKRPVLDPCLAVGFLPFSTDCLRVGQLVNMKWRVERLKSHEDASISGDEILYQIDANPQNWMIAGRKCGHISLSNAHGSRMEITVTCVPLVSGYVHPPQLGLPEVGEAKQTSGPERRTATLAPASLASGGMKASGGCVELMGTRKGSYLFIESQTRVAAARSPP